MSRLTCCGMIEIRLDTRVPTARTDAPSRGIAAKSACALCVRVFRFSGRGQASPSRRNAAMSAQTAPKRTSAPSAGWQPGRRTLPTINYPTARKASNSSILLRSPEVMHNAGVSQVEDSNANMVAG